MTKEKFKELGRYALKNPFDACLGVCLYIVAASAGISLVIYSVKFGYALIEASIP